MATKSNLKELSDEVLVQRGFELERNLVATRFQHSLGQLENTATLRSIRKEIARIKGEARAREIDQGLAKDELWRKHRAAINIESAAPSDAGAVEKGGFLSGIVDKLSGKD